MTILGGRPRQVTVDLDPAALAARGLDPLRVQQALAGANVRASANDIVSGDRAMRLESGTLARLGRGGAIDAVVGQAGGAPVRLADVAEVSDGGGEPTNYVTYHPARGRSFPAVTLSIAKRKGVNATALTRTIAESWRPCAGISCRPTSSCR